MTVTNVIYKPVFGGLHLSSIGMSSFATSAKKDDGVEVVNRLFRGTNTGLNKKQVSFTVYKRICGLATCLFPARQPQNLKLCSEKEPQAN